MSPWFGFALEKPLKSSITLWIILFMRKAAEKTPDFSTTMKDNTEVWKLKKQMEISGREPSLVCHSAWNTSWFVWEAASETMLRKIQTSFYRVNLTLEAPVCIWGDHMKAARPKRWTISPAVSSSHFHNQLWSLSLTDLVPRVFIMTVRSELQPKRSWEMQKRKHTLKSWQVGESRWSSQTSFKLLYD